MSKKKFGHKLGGSFAPLLTHTTKSPAWSMLCVGARALFGHLLGRYYQDREGYVFLSASYKELQLICPEDPTKPCLAARREAACVRSNRISPWSRPGDLD